MSRSLKKATKQQVIRLKPLLEDWVRKIERPEYIEDDPIMFMHAYADKEDRLLAGFFAALFAWGRRDIVISKTEEFLERMDNSPAQFITAFTEADYRKFEGFKHRTFKPVDLYWLSRILQSALNRHGSFEDFWRFCYRKAGEEKRELIAVFHEEFFALQPEAAGRSRKHISDSEKNSSCKRLYLYLRWAVRKESPVDTGLMDFMPPSELMIPLDVHVARQARKLGLLSRRYNDWKAVKELTANLRLLDPEDPVKYDYALFGQGVNEAEIPASFLLNRRIDA